MLDYSPVIIEQEMCGVGSQRCQTTMPLVSYWGLNPIPIIEVTIMHNRAFN